MKGHNPYFRTLSVLAVFAALTLLVMALAALTFVAPDSRAVQAVSPAAGSGQPSSPLTGQWVVVNSPNVGTGSNSLASVTGNAANDVTAVGSYFDSSSHEHTLIEHWDGSAWSVVPSQDPDPNLNRLSSVTSNKSGGYWAAGLSFSSTYGSLIEEQATAGASWTLVPVPTISGFPSLLSISADSPTDAWAVGDHSGGSPNFYQQTLVMHWNGTAWSQVTSPNPGSAHNYLTAVVAVDANNMWAVGYTNTPPSSNFSPITIHCDSSLTCASVTFPMAGTSSQLRAITGRPNGPSVELYASGYYTDGSGTHAYVGYGDGTGWSLINPSQAYVLNGIYAPSTTVPVLGAGGVIGVGDDETPGHTQIVPSSVTSNTVQPNWQSVPPVVVGTGTNLFFGVGGAPGGPLWAAGYSTGGSGPDQVLDYTQLEELMASNAASATRPPPTVTATPTCADPPGPSITPVLVQSVDLLYHTTLIAYDPSSRNHASQIRDTIFAGLVKNLLAPNGVSRCRDSKFMFQECFGGGMLQAVEGALGTTVKWVGGSASTYYQTSLGHEGGGVQAGDFWTESFGQALSQGGSLLQELKYAKDHDAVANDESGQYISANGGESIRLDDTCSESHHAILFAGYVGARTGDPGMRHYYDIASMRNALIGAWGTPNGTTITIDVLFGDGQHKPDGTLLPAAWNAQPGTELALDTEFEHLANLMNPNEQFLFYGSDHGGFQRDLFPTISDGKDNPMSTPTPIPLPPGGHRQDSFPLTQENLDALLNDPNSAPSLIISYTGSLDSNTAVSVSLNGSLLGYVQQGEVQVTLPVSKTVLTTNNQVLVQSSNSTTIMLNQETFDSGPIDTLPPPACVTTFSDVPSGSAFYPYVECLACAGMISGYPDGTFRPGNQVTRGQLAKIVSNAARYNDVYTTATFNDVPVGSTFYQYVERLSSRNIINGYPCGGPGEPCPGMYFRPNNNVTRGQTSKIVAIANGLPAPPQGQQTFQDVTPSSTFWPWIEALASTGTIGGYPCGGPGEPCVPPSNRPYFRPNNNVTRGQASKIVSKSFFPNCQAP